MSIIYFSPVIIVILLIVFWYFYDRKNIKKQVIALSKLDMVSVVGAEKSIQKNNSEEDEEKSLYFKLIQAGLTKKEYNEGRVVFIIMGLVLGIALPLFFSPIVGFIGILIGVLLCVFGGSIYLYISKTERVEKINSDLGTFLDLVNVILEAGGGLKNAFLTVSTRAEGIIDEQLLKEVAILEYEMSNYSTKKAYENLKKRVDSEDVAKVVDFLVLSEEAGIGVKNIFSAQSDEMRQEKFYKIKGKVNTLNMYLILIIFLFVLPALAAFIIFPMMAGSLNLGI